MHKKNIIGFIFLGLLISCSPKIASTSKGDRIGETVDLKNKNIDWESFDTNSVTSKNEIKIQNLQGLWSAYKGVYRFGNYVNEMNLSKPFVFEAKNDSYRRNDNGAFERFILKDNLIIKVESSKIDTGIINKITATELTISWKDKANYTRYYYKK